jgi:hypothetical protein
MTMASSIKLPFLNVPIEEEQVQENKSLFNEKEIEDFQRFLGFFSWQATQENSMYNTSLRETNNLASPNFNLESINESSLPITTPKQPEPLRSFEQPESPRLAKQPRLTKEYFQRFGKANNPEEKELSQIAESIGLGDVGTLSYSPYSNGKFRMGTLGFHEASVVGMYQGSLLELATTNQTTGWAQTNIFMNTDLFRDSPAMEPILEERPLFKTKQVSVPIGQTDNGIPVVKDVEAYVKEDGLPLLLGEFTSTTGFYVSPEFMANPQEPVTPNTIVGYMGEQPVTAAQVMPNTIVTKSPGLRSILRNEFEESFFQYNLGAVNNLERFGRVGDYGPADRSIGVFDLSVIPVLDVIQAYVSPETTNPAWIALNQSNKINGAELVNELKTRDPVLYQAWTEEGVNWDTLSQAKNAGEFRAHVNAVFVNNAINRAITTSQINSPYLYYVRQARELAYSTLTSGDAVAQSLILVGTAGLSSTVSLGLVGRGALTANRTAQVSRATIVSNLKTAQSFQRGLQTVTKFLPINLPGTTLELAATKLGTSLPRLAKLHQQIQKGKILGTKGLAWTVGQSLEGFVEEGVTDLFNQGYESIYGLRSGFDLGQTFDQALAGMVMEPILGSALLPLNVATSIVVNSPTYALVNGARLMNFSGSRVKEFNEYLSATKGNWETLSDFEKEIRMQTIARGLVFENTFGNFVEGDYSKAETAHTKFRDLITEFNSAGSSLNPGTAIEAAILFGDKLKTLNNAINSNSLSPNQLLQFEQAKKSGVFTQDTEKNIKLNQDVAETLIGFVVLGGEGRNTLQEKQAFLQRRFNREVEKQWEIENRFLLEDLEKETDEEERKTFSQELKAKLDERLANPDAITIANMDKLTEQMEILFNLLPDMAETIQNNELDSQTIDVINTANNSVQETIQDSVNRLTEEFNNNADKVVNEQTQTTQPQESISDLVSKTRTTVASIPTASEAVSTAPNTITASKTTEVIAAPKTESTTVSSDNLSASLSASNLKETVSNILKTLNIDPNEYLNALLITQGNDFEDTMNIIIELSGIYSGDDLKNQLKSFISC